MRNWKLAVSALLALSVGIFIGFTLRKTSASSARAVRSVPLEIVHGENALRTVIPKGCESFVAGDSTGVRIPGEVLVNEGTDALIVSGTFRAVFGDHEQESSQEWHVPVGERVSNVVIKPDATTDSRAARLKPLKTCIFFIDKTRTYVPPETGPPPAGPGARIGVAYPYGVQTHCGVTELEFDGRWWRVSPPLSADLNNPPPGWDENSMPGTIVLLARNRAEFRTKAQVSPRVAHLVPEPTPSALGECN